MSEEVQLVYINLNQLLDDICKFLKDGVNREALSPEARKQADNLIRRSTVQLQKISNITNELNGGGYMDMQNKITEKRRESEPIQASFRKEIISSEGSHLCPYLETAAKAIPQEEKCGYISWKTKFLFGFEKMKRIYAVIYRDWLLIYSNEKDSKPDYTYNLKTNKAQMLVTNKQFENTTQYFCLINIETQLMSQFMAQTHKDMLQWVAKINKSHQLMQKRQPREIEVPQFEVPVSQVNEIDEEDDSEETYNVIIVEAEDITTVKLKHIPSNDHLEEEEEEEDVYIDIEPRPLPPTSPPPPQVKNQNSVVKSTRIPTVLTRMQQIPLPPLPVVETSSTESLTYDNPVMLQNSSKLSVSSDFHDSFSEPEEEEEMYDEVIVSPSSMIQKTPESVMKGKVSPLSPMKREDVFASFKPAVMPKPVVMPNPAMLSKPKIDVKLMKPSGKSSTKHILKLAKEASIK